METARGLSTQPRQQNNLRVIYFAVKSPPSPIAFHEITRCWMGAKAPVCCGSSCPEILGTDSRSLPAAPHRVRIRLVAHTVN